MDKTAEIFVVSDGTGETASGVVRVRLAVGGASKSCGRHSPTAADRSGALCGSGRQPRVKRHHGVVQVVGVKGAAPAIR